jgi:hypothetical protein
MDEPAENAPVDVTPVLSYQAPRAYVPSQRIGSWASLLVVLVGGMLAAAIGAGLSMFWLVKRLPGSEFTMMGLHAVVVAVALIWLCRKAKFRNPSMALAIGIICGIASVVFFHYGLYVRNVLSFRDAALAEYATWKIDHSIPLYTQLVAGVKAHPFAMFDRIIIQPKTGHTGFVGYAILRAPEVGFIAILQVGAVALVAVCMTWLPMSTPFCESCKVWFNKPFNITVIRGPWVRNLAAAVESDDAVAVRQVISDAQGELESRMAIAQCYKCPSCGTRLVEVILKVGMDARTKPHLRPRRVSDEMFAALKWEPDEANEQSESAANVEPPPTTPDNSVESQ